MMRIIDNIELTSAPEKLEDFEVLFDEVSKETSIFIRSGTYAGVKYQYQKVTFNTDAEEPVMHFQYLVLPAGVQVPDEMKQKFENAIAEVLYSMLLDQIERQEVIYTGGTDPEES
jgi:hypothetical protein